MPPLYDPRHLAFGGIVGKEGGSLRALVIPIRYREISIYIEPAESRPRTVELTNSGRSEPANSQARRRGTLPESLLPEGNGRPRSPPFRSRPLPTPEGPHLPLNPRLSGAIPPNAEDP